MIARNRRLRRPIPISVLRRLQEEREAREFMQAQDEAYLNYVLYNGMFASRMHGLLEAAYEGMHWDTEPVGAHHWKFTFSTGKKCPGLRVATLTHPRLNIRIQEQNPTKQTPMALRKRAGKTVYQVFVNDEPVCCIEDGEHRYDEIDELRQSS